MSGPFHAENPFYREEGAHHRNNGLIEPIASSTPHRDTVGVRAWT